MPRTAVTARAAAILLLRRRCPLVPRAMSPAAAEGRIAFAQRTPRPAATGRRAAPAYFTTTRRRRHAADSAMSAMLPRFHATLDFPPPLLLIIASV
jgi:hypothetical protein